MDFLKAKTFMKKISAIFVGAFMLCATLTMALATTPDLGDYPTPFVTDGQYDNTNVIVVGTNAAASDTLGAVDIATNLQYEARDCTSLEGDNLVVTGATSEEVDLGETLADAFDVELDDSDIESLLDTSINFNGDNYDVREILKIRGDGDRDVTLQTSLTSNDDDYQSDVAMEFERNSVTYFYAFDDAIKVSDADDDDTLDIKFLGKTIRIISADDNSITAYVGAEYFLDVGDAVEVDGKTVTLKNVGSGGAVVVDVNGVSETIQEDGSKTINGIEVVNQEIFYDDSKVDRSATLIIGKDARENYDDGDAFVGEDKDDPEWVWYLDGLDTEAVTDVDAETGPIIAIRNDFVMDDESDNPPIVGECVELPNNYLSICLDDLTVDDSDYATYDIEHDDSIDVSDAIGYESWTSANGIVISTDEDEGFEMSNGKKTDTIYLISQVSGQIHVFYTDDDNDEQLLGIIYDLGSGITTYSGTFESGWATCNVAGGYGGWDKISHCYVAWDGVVQACTEPTRDATFTVGADEFTTTEISIEHLDGVAETFDSFQVKDGNEVLCEFNDLVAGPDEVWKTLVCDVADFDGEKVLTLHPTAANPWTSCETWGQVAIKGITYEGYGQDASKIAEVNYQNTKDNDVVISLEGNHNVANGVNIVLDVVDDQPIVINLNHAVDGGFMGFGLRVDTEDAEDLMWGAKTIGTKDNDLRTRYGIIINDPSSTLSDDEVSLDIPGDQVEGEVSIRGSSAIVYTEEGEQYCQAADITPATKLDTEIAGAEANYNVILVGGPCANGAVERVPNLGVTCAGWSLVSGEGMIKIVENGQKVAMFIGGTDAINTRQAAKIISNYKDYTLKGQEVLVKGTTLDSITVETISGSEQSMNETA